MDEGWIQEQEDEQQEANGSTKLVKRSLKRAGLLDWDWAAALLGAFQKKLPSASLQVIGSFVKTLPQLDLVSRCYSTLYCRQ